MIQTCLPEYLRGFLLGLLVWCLLHILAFCCVDFDSAVGFIAIRTVQREMLVYRNLGLLVLFLALRAFIPFDHLAR